MQVCHGIDCVGLTIAGPHQGAAVLTPAEAGALADIGGRHPLAPRRNIINEPPRRQTRSTDHNHPQA